MKKIIILGSSGSIGQTALRLLSGSSEFRVVGLAVRSNTESLMADAAKFGVRDIAVADKEAASELRKRLPDGMKLYSGDDGITELASLDADILLCAMVGMAGLPPVMKAIETGKDIALATKEVLVAAGEIVMRERAKRNVRILPVDSEHSAIFQALQSAAYTPACVRTATPGDGGGACLAEPAEKAIRKLILTASGGPFFNRPELDFEKVTVADALNHPKWKMGRKITVDSASMMNKGLEIIEARWLFNVPVDKIDVVIHPESIVHSLVEYIDGTQIAELSVPDMTFAINYALTWPRRTSIETFGSRPSLLDLASAGQLRFFAPDPVRFPPLRLAREASARGKTYTAVLNGANEIAVEAFLGGRIGFSAIWKIVEKALDAHRPGNDSSLEEVFEADRWARAYAGGLTESIS